MNLILSSVMFPTAPLSYFTRLPSEKWRGVRGPVSSPLSFLL